MNGEKYEINQILFADNTALVILVADDTGLVLSNTCG